MGRKQRSKPDLHSDLLTEGWKKDCGMPSAFAYVNYSMRKAFCQYALCYVTITIYVAQQRGP